MLQVMNTAAHLISKPEQTNFNSASRSPLAASPEKQDIQVRRAKVLLIFLHLYVLERSSASSVKSLNHLSLASTSTYETLVATLNHWQLRSSYSFWD
jgi:hypothetical protein